MTVIIIDAESERRARNERRLSLYTTVKCFSHIAQAYGAGALEDKGLTGIVVAFDNDVTDSSLALLATVKQPVFAVGEMSTYIIEQIRSCELHVSQYFLYEVLPEEMDLEIQEKQPHDFIYVHSDFSIYMARNRKMIYELPAVFQQNATGYQTFNINRSGKSGSYAIPFHYSETKDLVRPSSLADPQWFVLLAAHIWQQRIESTSLGAWFALDFWEWNERDRIRGQLFEGMTLGRFGQQNVEFKLNQIRMIPMISAAVLDTIILDDFHSNSDFLRYPSEQLLLVYYIGFQKSEWLLCTPYPYRGLAHGLCPVTMQLVLKRYGYFQSKETSIYLHEEELRTGSISNSEERKLAMEEAVNHLQLHIKRICSKLRLTPKIVFTGDAADEFALFMPDTFNIQVVDSPEYSVIRGLTKRHELDEEGIPWEGI
ncbi:hypothetical protein WJ0W_007122 [Paenibacillus melissococcoides]|uniref:Uncharacterized protein n=1 Tax=Paenibacillus melissococcoides TaxID=2912268 RepID=A0ABM9G9M5_9BACL|nr:hypothetical protein [Paenibacillus melissococcoides]CAH8248454.1 hypothetical protein WJ0W_007122 [Paenibacillus melissococcoides]CAH8722051.1 hypothetical protein HTL2_006668 [Paenibacillus melissococcoides]CAH8722154.1 hypothetical protein WDD9_006657 [Paenibacillus melissococcoides]